MPSLSTPGPAPGTYVARAGGPSRWGRLLHAVADKRRALNAARELYRMSDKLLHDIGLDRRGIDHAVRFGRE